MAHREFGECGRRDLWLVGVDDLLGCVDELARAVQLTGDDNVSAVIDEALAMLIERKLEQLWLDAHPASDLPGETVPDLSDIPWEP